MNSPERMPTPEELEETFETDRLFSDEPTAQTLGRVAWLGARHSAEFALTLFSLGVDEAKIPSILEAVEQIGEDYYELVAIGLTGGNVLIQEEEHPLEGSLDETVDKLVDAISDAHNIDIIDEMQNDGGLRLMTFGGMEDEDLLHQLQGQIRRIRAQDLSE